MKSNSHKKYDFTVIEINVLCKYMLADPLKYYQCGFQDAKPNKE